MEREMIYCILTAAAILTGAIIFGYATEQVKMNELAKHNCSDFEPMILYLNAGNKSFSCDGIDMYEWGDYYVGKKPLPQSKME
jgi:hypothetical protein